MLDIKFVKSNPNIVKENLKKRFQKEKIPWVDEIIKGHDNSIKIKKELDDLRHKKNIISEEINLLKKHGKDIANKIKEIKELPHRINSLEENYNHLQKDIQDKLYNLPNILDKSVPLGENEQKNKVIKKVGVIKKPKFAVKNHADFAYSLNLLDLDKASKVAGARFYYLKNDLVKLNQALLNFALDFLAKKKFNLIQPPYMLNKKSLSGAITFSTFEDTIYKIDNEDLYLIGTAEHAINAYHSDEVVDEKSLPLRYAGISPCFRKEAGAHGKDTKGIFRVHQFEKIEQFVFCKPDQAEKEFNLLLKNVSDIYKALKLPFRLMLLCSADTGNVPSNTIDLEAWFPAQNTYRELASCSNCTDYQARRSNSKFKSKDNETKYLYTLNSTAIPTTRTIACILENYQQKDGSLKIPKVLQKYVGKKIIKSVKK
jgi:seryl-tRNA synthetase